MCIALGRQLVHRTQFAKYIGSVVKKMIARLKRNLRLHQKESEKKDIAKMLPSWMQW